MKRDTQDIYLNCTKTKSRMKVNLDALIQREDFGFTGAADSSNLFPNISIYNLEPALPLLRKPDFQRETSEWDKRKIFDLLDSLFSQDLIPAIILWQSKSNYYVVLDGGHRLSALIAWYKDDYGAGEISRKFYNNDISEAQIEMHNKTKAFIDAKIGSYKDVMKSLNAPSPNPRHFKIAQKLGVGIPIQWQPGDSQKAQKSFFKINRQGAPLNPTERKLLEARKKPTGIAARAILKRGKGYKYWKDFDDTIQEKITSLAEQIHDKLFLPPFSDFKAVNTLDLPIAGTLLSAQTLPLVYDLITLSSNLDIKNLNEDKTGEQTVSVLQNLKSVVYTINSKSTNSLGLHPAVYFFSSLGRHQPTAVLAIAELVKEFEVKNFFSDFTRYNGINVRELFEDFIIKYKTFFNQVTKKYGSGMKGYKHLKDLLWVIIRLVMEGNDEDLILKCLSNDKNFKFLNPKADIEDDTYPKKFSKSVKSGIFVKTHLPAKARCGICNGHIHLDGITGDHILEQMNGGLGQVKNGQLAHPYCNEIFKRVKLSKLAKN